MGGTSQGEATVYQKHRALLTRKGCIGSDACPVPEG